MEGILPRVLWFIVGCNVTAISLAYSPKEECVATAARLWQWNAWSLFVVGALMIAIGFSRRGRQ